MIAYKVSYIDWGGASSYEQYFLNQESAELCKKTKAELDVDPNGWLVEEIEIVEE